MTLDIVFMGSPDFSVPILHALAGRHRVTHVYCQPPRAAGRGKKPRPTPVHAAAEAMGLPVSHPERLRDPADQQAFAALKADVAVVAAYGLILPQPVLDAPRLGCVNVHASLLPRWRGAAPIQRAVMAGDAETGVTIMQMEAGLDTGPMLLEESLPIGPQDTGGTVHDALSALGARLILPALDGLEAGTLPARPQPQDGVTYAAKIDKAESRIDWTLPAVTVDRIIRGLSPYPGAFAEVADGNGGTERLKVLLSRPEVLPDGAAVDGIPGTVLDDRLLVACGAGAVRLLIVQRPGKGPMEAEAFLRGRSVPAGTRLA